MRSLRLVVHALDRTGPPVLARSLLRWLRSEHGDIDVDVVAFRGGELLHDIARLAPVRVALDPEEDWDVEHPSSERIDQLAHRLGELPAVDASLLVSVSSGAALPLLGGETGPIVTWAVEQEEPFPPGLVDRTDLWLGGSNGTVENLRRRLPAGTPMGLAPEFVEPSAHLTVPERRRLRLALGAGPDEILVLGAGIATHRKAPDLFAEVALACARRNDARFRFAWLGGERDPLFHAVRDESARLGLDRLRLHGSVPDVTPWFAAADVFLHPARFDAFPLVCLHAANAGTPVLAFSGAGGVTEMFGPTFRGAPYPDVVGLTDQLLSLADPAARRAVAAAQQAHVVQRYLADVAAPALLEQVRPIAGVPQP